MNKEFCLDTELFFLVNFFYFRGCPYKKEKEICDCGYFLDYWPVIVGVILSFTSIMFWGCLIKNVRKK